MKTFSTQEINRMKKPFTHLELFSGTKSWGKITEKSGMRVISVDIDPAFDPTIVSNIATLKYKELPVPDLITASPPCNSFSTLARARKTRDWFTLEQLHPNAEIGTKLLEKTIEIIRYFRKKNPKLLFVIENPRAMMGRMPVINRLPRQTTEYCLYDYRWKKPTDFWHNFPSGLGLQDPLTTTKPCDKEELIPVVNIPVNERYKIPERLVATIVKSFLRDYGRDPIPVSLRRSDRVLYCRK